MLIHVMYIRKGTPVRREFFTFTPQTSVAEHRRPFDPDYWVLQRSELREIKQTLINAGMEPILAHARVARLRNFEVSRSRQHVAAA